MLNYAIKLHDNSVGRHFNGRILYTSPHISKVNDVFIERVAYKTEQNAQFPEQHNWFECQRGPTSMLKDHGCKIKSCLTIYFKSCVILFTLKQQIAIVFKCEIYWGKNYLCNNIYAFLCKNDIHFM